MASSKISRAQNYIPGSGLPPAVIAARAESVAVKSNVLYDLVKHIQGQGEELRFESNSGIVNVIPRGRLYRLESLEELDTFKIELLRRPTVLQCQFRTGSGMAGCSYFPTFDCRMGTLESDWLIMLNQLHPKILSRFQMGIEMTRSAMKQGIPCILQFSFNEKFREIMRSLIGPAAENYSYLNCEAAEIIIIYGGKPTQLAEVTNVARSREILFNFEDLSEDDVLLRTPDMATEHVNVGTEFAEGDLKKVLRGWEFSLSQDPTSEPRSRYSYATAGRMFYDLQQQDEMAESQI